MSAESQGDPSLCLSCTNPGGLQKGKVFVTVPRATCKHWTYLKDSLAVHPQGLYSRDKLRVGLRTICPWPVLLLANWVGSIKEPRVESRSGASAAQGILF